MWGDITSTLPVAQPFISEYSENVFTPSFSVGLLNPRSIASATKSITYKLPAPDGCPGKIYYIKNCIAGAQDYKVTCEGASNTNKKMILMNESTLREYVELGGNRASMWISTGEYWCNFLPH